MFSEGNSERENDRNRFSFIFLVIKLINSLDLNDKYNFYSV